MKDEIENKEYTDAISDRGIRKITLPEADEYLEQRKKSSKRIAKATMLCIIAIFPLLLLGAASEKPDFIWSEEFACGVGLVAIFLIPIIQKRRKISITDITRARGIRDMDMTPHKSSEKGEK